MTDWRDLEEEMDGTLLEPDAADILLAGSPADALPAAYAEAAVLLGALRAPARRDELVREGATVAAMASVLLSPTPSKPRRRRRMSLGILRIRVAIVAAALVLAATATAAATDNLPTPAQDIVTDVLAKLGLELPGGAGDEGEGIDPATLPAPASGIVELARDDELHGLDKGTAVAGLASGGASDAGRENAGGHGSAGASPVETPASGGAATANVASGGASEPGTSVAEEASGGASSAGAGNADAGAGNADAGEDGLGAADQAIEDAPAEDPPVTLPTLPAPPTP